jgi:cytidylate kinase
MAFISISGEPGCRHEELARIITQRLDCELVTDSRLADTIAAEFGASYEIPEKAWPHLAVSILAKLGVEHHVVTSAAGSELLSGKLLDALRVHLVAPELRRIGNLMVDRGLERAEAKERLRALDAEQALVKKRRFGGSGKRSQAFDLVLNAEGLGIEQMLDVVETAVKTKGLLDAGLLTPVAEAQIQYQVRLSLAKYGIVPPDRVHETRREFGHPSEEVFANLLDFYRIAWDYEPRSFPLQWDKDGKVLEAFTPDFYLSEFDLYVELTTMKQANVTKKNRKIRLLRAIYPHVNIQVFYQKDVQELVIKYGLPERLAK